MSSSRARIGEWSCGKATVGIGGQITTSTSWNSACQRARRPLRTRPVLVQAGKSDQGKNLASRVADLIFTAAATLLRWEF